MTTAPVFRGFWTLAERVQGAAADPVADFLASTPARITRALLRRTQTAERHARRIANARRKNP